MMGKLYAVGFGPGGYEHMTAKAIDVIKNADVITGYTTYVEMLKKFFPDKEYVATPMTKEMDRCRMAVDLAAEGKTVAMVSSGDSGIYGMAGILLEIANEKKADVEIETVPGVTAASAAASVLGAPLMHDFTIISLSDLMTPYSLIMKRVDCAGQGAIFQTTIDSEVIAYHVAKERIFAATAEEAVLAAMRKLKGAYSLIVMSPRKLIGARDPFGFRPLCIGKRDNTYFLTSETCALDTVGAEFVRDVEPGEVVTLTPKGIESNKELCFKDPSKQARCIFEYIYFARPDAVIDGVGVYASRIKAGKFLAMDSPVDADMVVGVPESGNPAAQGYAMESGIPYGTAFIKNSYVGRTFIKPKQSMRESSVQVKLNVLKDAVKGKRIVMIDDSIVRGTTCRRIVRMLKDAGAKEVHVRISSPPFLHPCYFGTDIPSEDQLVAYGKTLDEICESIEADTLAYLHMDRLKELNEGLPYCDACFSGNYPIEPPTQDIRGEQG